MLTFFLLEEEENFSSSKCVLYLDVSGFKIDCFLIISCLRKCKFNTFSLSSLHWLSFIFLNYLLDSHGSVEFDLHWNRYSWVLYFPLWNQLMILCIWDISQIVTFNLFQLHWLQLNSYCAFEAALGREAHITIKCRFSYLSWAPN